MSISNFGAVQPLHVNFPQLQSPPTVGLGEGGIAFQELLGAYMNIVGDAGRIEQHAQELMVDFVLGNHDDMLSVILAQEMAATSMSFAVQITSRIVEAYREIMRMQI